ncbi:hypothetical protein MPTK1_8g05540 [Marchantia polymorpha subsp. ruderalis]|uniref:Uncharacterized protein n=1 Tax=Marchantia polymorpha TaxID=3197 RepID=A0A2R6WKE7_MARPO|nr:hypothetical protein MARPO_0081s0055 [Marchantia polymorpha]BBN18791.1 hypothetical protein Mp_8g05540 [Marchantia polymorpha subsp. ruderalis]|eukprot:PTQ34329.1 hypothetical protein MARPO_0081s0055 [Marchantia polymorpha]
MLRGAYPALATWNRLDGFHPLPQNLPQRPQLRPPPPLPLRLPSFASLASPPQRAAPPPGAAAAAAQRLTLSEAGKVGSRSEAARQDRAGSGRTRTVGPSFSPTDAGGGGRDLWEIYWFKFNRASCLASDRTAGGIPASGSCDGASFRHIFLFYAFPAGRCPAGVLLALPSAALLCFAFPCFVNCPCDPASIWGVGTLRRFWVTLFSGCVKAEDEVKEKFDLE